MKAGACRLVFSVVLPAVAAAGCAGARVNVTAERAQYPISLSDAVRDPSGALYAPQSLQRVGDFSLEASRMGVFYSLWTPRANLDISDAVNVQVAAAKGEAVIRLSVTVSDSCAVLNAMPVLNVLPLWPGCVPVSISGQIVRRKQKP